MNRPQPTGDIIVELDEMWHYLTHNLTHKKTNFRSGKHIVTGQLIDWECGGRDSKILKVMLQRLKKLSISLFFTDHWEAYKELIPSDLLIQTNAKTHGIE